MDKGGPKENLNFTSFVADDRLICHCGHVYDYLFEVSVYVSCQDYSYT